MHTHAHTHTHSQLHGMRRRTIKDVTYSGKEIESQQNRIQRTKDDAEKDDYDVRKQEEVLAEYIDGRKYELTKLAEFADTLEAFLVRAPARTLEPAGARVLPHRFWSPSQAECAQDADTQKQLDPTEELLAAKKALTDARAIVAAGPGA